MKISVLDASNYFKGLLLLIRKDEMVTQPEIDLMKGVGKALGFEKEFCADAIREILDNRYIDDSPPRFSIKELAGRFVKDGLTLSFVDHEEIHPEEAEWLKAAAQKNGIASEDFLEEMRKARSQRGEPLRLEVYDLVVEYF
jgi:hypothetical protein